MAGRRFKRVKLNGGERMKPRSGIIRSILTWGVEIAIVVLIAFAVVFFFGQQRTLVGPSMEPTLVNEDKVLINVIAYQFSKPKRNDIIVFKPNGNQSTYSYIKRVVGLPGETIQIKDGLVYIDDVLYSETIEVPLMNTAGLASTPITLRSDEVFVLGDSRNNSEDSRASDIGNVKIDDIEGKAWFVMSGDKFRLLKK